MQTFPDLEIVLGDDLLQMCDQISSPSNTEQTSSLQAACSSILDLADFDLEKFEVTFTDDNSEPQPVYEPISPASEPSSSQSTESDQITSPSSSESTSSPKTECPSLLDLTHFDFGNFELTFPDDSSEPQPAYEPISPASEPSRSQTTETDRSITSYNDSSPSPPSSTSSSPSPMQQSSTSSDESVQDALDALEKKLSQPTYAESKVNESKSSKEPKPDCSYIAMIVQAILSVPEKKMVLGDIYQYIMDNFPYYNNKERAWRNSIRHNLSLNECFVKSGRNDGGKGNYWAIHPSCVEDFANGDYRRRHARKRARGANLKTAAENDTMTNHKLTIRGTRASYHPYATTSNVSRKMPYSQDFQVNSTTIFDNTPASLASADHTNSSSQSLSSYAVGLNSATSYLSSTNSFGNLNEFQPTYSQQGSGYTYQIPQNSTMTQYNPLTSQGATSSSRPNTISYRPNNAQYQNNVTSWQNTAYGVNGNYFTSDGLQGFANGLQYLC